MKDASKKKIFTHLVQNLNSYRKWKISEERVFHYYQTPHIS